MKSFLAAFCLLLSSVAFAAASSNCNIQANGLSPDATAALVAQCESAIQQEQSPTAKLQQLSTAGTVAKDVAVAIGIAAKEIGIAANEFFQSDAGTFVAFIIFWKVAGATALNMIIAIVGLITIMTILWKVFRRLSAHSYTYEYKPALWGLYNRRYVISDSAPHFSTFESGPHFFLLLLAVVTVVAFFITMAHIP